MLELLFIRCAKHWANMLTPAWLANIYFSICQHIMRILVHHQKNAEIQRLIFHESPAVRSKALGLLTNKFYQQLTNDMRNIVSETAKSEKAASQKKPFRENPIVSLNNSGI